MRIISNAFNSKGQIVKVALYDSYIKAIRNSIGSKLFRNLYAYVDGEKRDIARNGTLACDIYVSSTLLMFGLIDKLYATVDSCVSRLPKCGWYRIKKPRPGAILVWEAVKFPDRQKHKHIGFYIGKNKAVSNNYKKRVPAAHHWNFGGNRRVTQIFWNKRLSDRI